MLDDTTRKVYRVIGHLHKFEWFMIDVELIARYAVRSEQQVKDSSEFRLSEVAAVK